MCEDVRGAMLSVALLLKNASWDRELVLCIPTDAEPISLYLPFLLCRKRKSGVMCEMRGMALRS
jgi:hypothetical protein